MASVDRMEIGIRLLGAARIYKLLAPDDDLIVRAANGNINVGRGAQEPVSLMVVAAEASQRHALLRRIVTRYEFLGGRSLVVAGLFASLAAANGCLVDERYARQRVEQWCAEAAGTAAVVLGDGRFRDLVGKYANADRDLVQAAYAALPGTVPMLFVPDGDLAGIPAAGDVDQPAMSILRLAREHNDDAG